MEKLYEQIAHCIEYGKINNTSPYPPDMKGMDGADELTKKALEQGYSPEDILKNALVIGMENVGVKFRENKIFVPQVLMSAKAMNAAMEHLKQFFSSGAVKRKGIFIIGTVEGDLHDIGKNLVGMMLEGAGFNVVDAGINVEAQKFIELAKENNATLIGASALLTTTMTNMKEIVDAVKAAGMGDNLKVMIGGAPLTQSFCDEIGADGYAPDAASAADLAKTLVA